jgi:hypothetical protein
MIPLQLSERNLYALLAKLPEQSLLTKPGGLCVEAQTDEAHYNGRAYGKMNPDTEMFIKLMRKAAVIVKDEIQRQYQPVDDQRPPEWAIDAAMCLRRKNNPEDMCCGCGAPTECCDLTDDAWEIFQAFRRELKQ